MKTSKIDKRVEKLYYQNCSGVQINILDITRVFNAGRAAERSNPAISDEELTKVLVDFVDTIRKN